MEEKGGHLDAETVTQEMLDSSDSVLQSYMGRGTRGLQQYFTPKECAELVHNVFGDIIVLDPTAGNGGLIREFPENNQFGIEIDPVQVKDCKYTAINGDLQKVQPLLRMADMRFQSVALNPPFGLMWEDAVIGRKNSTVIAYLYSLDLMSRADGQGVLVCGSDRFTREILELEESNLFYAAIDVPDMFMGEESEHKADIRTVVAFYTNQPAQRLERWECLREELPQQTERVKGLRRFVRGFSPPSYARTYDIADLKDDWKKIQEEYKTKYAISGSRQKHTVSSNGKKISIHLSPYQRLTLSKRGDDYTVSSLHGQSVQYFIINTAIWNQLKDLETDGHITIDPKFRTSVQNMIDESEKSLCPLYPIKPQQRLGYLPDIKNVLCIKSDESRGYEEGQKYPVHCQSKINTMEFEEEKADLNTGDVYVVNKRQEAKVLEIEIGNHTFNETAVDIEYICAHFEIINPGDLLSRFPEQTTQMLERLTKIEEIYGGANGDWKFRPFQKDDIARLLMKKGGGLFWEQGLGKTLAALAFSKGAVKLGADDKVLFIVPQDLIPQWAGDDKTVGESQRFFGEELTLISSTAQARQIAKELQAGGVGWFITYFEAISRNGRQFELFKGDVPKHKRYREGSKYKAHSKYTKRIIALRERIKMRDTDPENPPKESNIVAFCPECGEAAQHGKWFPSKGLCKACGYRHIKIKAKPAYKFLTKAFKNGVAVVDEGTLIKSNDSLTSLSIRGIKAQYKMIMTGTPAKNFLKDAYWLLAWSLGYNSQRFPFEYKGGYDKFVKDFCVMEYTLDDDGSKMSSKLLPEVTNLSVLWRLLTSSVIRRRKEDTGEVIVDKTIVPVYCPLGIRQKQMYSKWLMGFADYFIDKYPDKKISEWHNLVERYSAILGQNWKLEFSSVLPESEPDKYYERGSNWTPANVKILELAMEHAQKGEKILIGSSLAEHGVWIANKLVEKGVPARHIMDQTADGWATKSPKKRASVIQDFKHNGTSCLCTSFGALQLGHNLAEASVVICHSVPWDHSSFEQFIARVHRLTSKKPVTIYVVMTNATIDIRKFELVNKKSAASSLAFDGCLYEQRTEKIDMQQIINELIAKGIPADEETIDESMLKRLWDEKPSVCIESHKKELKPEIQQQLNMFNMFRASFDAWKEASV